MKNMGGPKLLFVVALTLLILASTGAAVSLSNSGGGNWQNYMEITIKEKSGSTLTDYQISVQMSGGNFPANGDSKIVMYYGNPAATGASDIRYSTLKPKMG